MGKFKDLGSLSCIQVRRTQTGVKDDGKRNPELWHLLLVTTDMMQTSTHIP